MSDGARRMGTLSPLQKAQVGLIAWLGWAVLWLVNSTLRYEARSRSALDKARAKGQRVIFSFWHNQLFSAIYYFRFQGIAVMVSSHFDGEYSSRMAQRFGYRPARGSSSRRSLAALRELARFLEEGSDVAFTVDGPRGPRQRVKSGPLWLARHTGCCIAPFYIQPMRYWELKSWDRFRIPKPFSRVIVQFGEPFGVDGPEEEWIDRYQEAMDSLESLCRRRAE